MTHDVFISYSTQDKNVADALCAALESRKIRCWIAPRDVLPGTDYPTALIQALNTSRILVLVFSKEANKSTHVMREVEKAVDIGIPIIPFRIENVEPSEAMEYLIGTKHWLDALTPPLEKHLEKLADTIQILLANNEGQLPSTPARKEDSKTTTKTLTHPSIKKTKLKTKQKLIVAALAIITILILSAFFLYDSHLPVNPSSQKVLDFTPKGTANVELVDGSGFQVPANCFVYVDSSDLVNGLLDNNSEVFTFDRMKSFIVENSSIIATMQDNSILNLTRPEYGYHSDLFTNTFIAPSGSGLHIWPVNDVRGVSFDFSIVWEQNMSIPAAPIPLATVTTRSGEMFKAPASMIMFLQVLSSDMGPSFHWNTGLLTQAGTDLPFSKITRFEFTATGYTTPVIITTTDGEAFNTTMSDDNYFLSYFCGINQMGPFKLSMENDLKSIDFDWNS